MTHPAQEKHLVLHIGTHKTGTTAIQQAMADHAEFLRGRSIEPVNANSDRNLMEVFFPHRFRLQFEDVDLEEKKRVFEAWSSSVEARTIVLSSEHMTRVAGSWQVLAQRAGTVFRDYRKVTIVLYVRRQDLLIESMYQEDLKNGNIKHTSILDYMDHKDPYKIDYYRELQWYRQHLPQAQVLVRLYTDAVSSGDVFRHFLSTLGVIELPPQITSKASNLSLDEVACMILALSELDRRDRKFLAEVLRRKYPEHVKPPTKALRLLPLDRRWKIILHHHESNRRLFQDYELGSDADLELWEKISPECVDHLSPEYIQRKAIKFLGQCLVRSEQSQS